jgi:hypothetical protein
MRNERRTPAGTQISRVRMHVYSPMNVRKKHSYSSFRVGRPSQLQSRELLRGLLPAIFDSGSTFRSRERRRVRFVRIFARSMYNATMYLFEAKTNNIYSEYNSCFHLLHLRTTTTTTTTTTNQLWLSFNEDHHHLTKCITCLWSTGCYYRLSLRRLTACVKAKRFENQVICISQQTLLWEVHRLTTVILMHRLLTLS